MPENGKEKLVEGQISGEVHGPTTDESIVRQIRLLRHEITGIPNPQVVIDVTTDPVSVRTMALGENDLGSQISGPTLVLSKDSPIQIFELREQKRVARDLRDIEALTQLKKAA